MFVFSLFWWTKYDNLLHQDFTTSGEAGRGGVQGVTTSHFLYWVLPSPFPPSDRSRFPPPSAPVFTWASTCGICPSTRGADLHLSRDISLIQFYLTWQVFIDGLTPPPSLHSPHGHQVLYINVTVWREIVIAIVVPWRYAQHYSKILLTLRPTNQW